MQDNDGSDASVEFAEFDDVTSVGTPEDKDNDDDHAQGGDDMDGASSASSHVGPPPMIDSNRIVNNWADDTDDEEEEIEQLPVGVIPSEDDDLDGVAKHRKDSDMDAVY
jgi:hypothetical protein